MQVSNTCISQDTKQLLDYVQQPTQNFRGSIKASSIIPQNRDDSLTRDSLRSLSQLRRDRKQILSLRPLANKGSRREYFKGMRMEVLTKASYLQSREKVRTIRIKRLRRAKMPEREDINQFLM